ncbi:MAG: thrombospondin type 3 repeat-containing protein [Planctomycetes bacterium]|nr:thrombospondin type 3 repeat-containing protein [Planctomycetota bacterium]
MRRAFLIVLLIAAGVRGDIINGGDVNPHLVYFSSDKGQTFTAVDSQIRIASVGVQANNTTTGFSGTVAIYEGTGLDEFPVASQSRSDIPNGRFGWVDFEFDNPVDLVVGHTYTLWISTDQPGFYLLAVRADPYAGGELIGDTSLDLWFRILTAPLPYGACCINGSCIDGISEATCSSVGGTYQGSGRSCSENNNGICIPRTCCTDVGCFSLTDSDCTSRDDWQEWYRSSNDCYRCIPPLGACCFTGVCIPGQTEETCLDALATWAGPLTDCEACPPCEGPDFDGDGAEDNCDTDIDNDGVKNVDDVCDFTPAGLDVQDNGTVLADLDGDCNVDLRDYALWQVSLTGP